MIQDVRTKQLRVIPDERGRLMETLRCDDDLFVKFGQAYITTAYPGVVKGWHYHKIQIDHFVALKGMFKVVLYDGREDSPGAALVVRPRAPDGIGKVTSLGVEQLRAAGGRGREQGAQGLEVDGRQAVDTVELLEPLEDRGA